MGGYFNALREATVKQWASWLAWLFFRHPEEGWRRVAISATVAFIAILVPAQKLNLLKLATPITVPLGQAQVSVEEALVFGYCQKYGQLSPPAGNGRFLHRQAWPEDRFSDLIASGYGSVAAFCRQDFASYFGSENSQQLALIALLALPGDGPYSLALKQLLLECAFLFLGLFFLALAGVGVVPLLFVSAAAAKIMSIDLMTSAISQYRMMYVLPLFMSGLIALFWPLFDRKRLVWLLLAGLPLGLVLAFVFNWRTSYGLVMAGQIGILLAVIALKSRPVGPVLAKGCIFVAAVVAGFLTFQATLIWPLERGIGYSGSNHPIWHPIVLGLATTGHHRSSGARWAQVDDPDFVPNALAEREGIRWLDTVGDDLAKRMDPQATYLGPRYEAALRAYYFQLWRRYPREMLQIYADHVFATSRTIQFGFLGRRVHPLIANGFVWFAFLLGAAVAGYLLLPAASQLARVMIMLATGLIAISLEVAAIVPAFFFSYQGSLVVGFEGLVAVMLALAVALLSRRCASAPGHDPSFDSTRMAQAGDRI